MCAVSEVRKLWDNQAACPFVILCQQANLKVRELRLFEYGIRLPRVQSCDGPLVTGLSLTISNCPLDQNTRERSPGAGLQSPPLFPSTHRFPRAIPQQLGGRELCGSVQLSELLLCRQLAAVESARLRLQKLRGIWRPSILLGSILVLILREVGSFLLLRQLPEQMRDDAEKDCGHRDADPDAGLRSGGQT